MESKKANWKLFRQICEKEITNDLIQDNIETTYNKLEKVIIDTAEKCIPYQKQSQVRERNLVE